MDFYIILSVGVLQYVQTVDAEASKQEEVSFLKVMVTTEQAKEYILERDKGAKTLLSKKVSKGRSPPRRVPCCRFWSGFDMNLRAVCN